MDNTIKLSLAEFNKIIDDAYGIVIGDNVYDINPDYELPDGSLVMAFVSNSDDTDTFIIPFHCIRFDSVLYNSLDKTFTIIASNIPPFRILKVISL